MGVSLDLSLQREAKPRKHIVCTCMCAGHVERLQSGKARCARSLSLSLGRKPSSPLHHAGKVYERGGGDEHHDNCFAMRCLLALGDEKCTLTYGHAGAHVRMCATAERAAASVFRAVSLSVFSALRASSLLDFPRLLFFYPLPLCSHAGALFMCSLCACACARITLPEPCISSAHFASRFVIFSPKKDKKHLPKRKAAYGLDAGIVASTTVSP